VSVGMLSVVMLSRNTNFILQIAIVLTEIVLCFALVSVIMLSVIMPTFMAPNHHKIAINIFVRKSINRTSKANG
jgi:hypothetical protein